MPDAGPAIPRLQYTWEWDRREHLRVFRAVQRNARGGLVLRGIGWVLAAFAVLGVAFVAWAFLTSRRSAAWAELPWVFVLVAWLGLFRWWIPHASARAFRRLHTGPLHLVVDAEGLDTGSEVSNVRMRWPAFRRILEEPDFFLFFFSGRAAFYLPKRAIVGEDALRAFRAHVRAAVGERARLA